MVLMAGCSGYVTNFGGDSTDRIKITVGAAYDMAHALSFSDLRGAYIPR